MKNSLFTFVFLLVSITANAYDAKINGIYYNLIPKGKVAFVTNGDVKYEGDITIPSTIVHEGEEYNVKEIVNEAFYNCSNLLSLMIPNSITKIGDKAFYGCERLKRLVLPDEMEELPNNMCGSCTQLTDVTLPSRLRTLSAGAFSDCVSLASISLPEDLVEIGNGAFDNCISLTSIVIPHHVSILGNSAFHSCINLASIRLPDNLSRIPNSCFATCLKLSEINLPDGIDAIGTDAFANCESLSHLTIPNSVTYIDSRAFAGSSLTSVDFLSTDTKIGEGLFTGCKQLTSILSWPFTSVHRQTFKDCTGLVDLEIPEGVELIDVSAFEGCTNLQTVIIPKSMQWIANWVFKDCQNLKDVYIYCENLPNGHNYSAFEGSYVEYATLHVPASALEVYRSTKPWSEFGSIVAIEGTGIEQVTWDKSQVTSEEWYTLEGIRVAQPRKGIYIHNGKKIILK